MCINVITQPARPVNKDQENHKHTHIHGVYEATYY